MAEISRTTATLRLFGDDLDPDMVSALLGAQPTHSSRKGEARRSKSGPLVAKTGSWLLSASDQSPGDLEAQIERLLAGLTSDLEVWSDLGRRFRIDIFCGLFMEDGNEGLVLSPRVLGALGERGMEVSLDIYRPTED